MKGCAVQGSSHAYCRVPQKDPKMVIGIRRASIIVLIKNKEKGNGS